MFVHRSLRKPPKYIKIPRRRLFTLSMLKLSRSLMIFSSVYGGEGREVHLLVLNLLKSLAEQAL